MRSSDRRARRDGCSASASRASPRSWAASPEQGLRHPRDQDVRLGGLRLHPTGKAILKLGVKSQGQGHETTFAQIVAEERRDPPEDIRVEEEDTDTTPYGLGTYASRSTPTAGAATALVARTLREKAAKKIAAHLLEASEDDLDWDDERFSVKGAPDRGEDESRR